MQAYKIMARNDRTKQRVQEQDLAGAVITDHERAVIQAQLLANKMASRSRDSWTAEVQLYTVGHKPGSELV
jgi:hypothetical protein